MKIYRQTRGKSLEIFLNPKTFLENFFNAFIEHYVILRNPLFYAASILFSAAKIFVQYRQISL